ncbi:MAG: metallophosphoesterase [Candidatus Diapherotrites archaeon]|uniref:DNA polymerase II small subunit n=1 Tax=Candidatus Iainarchaeum sp. TaxID=3101447 RepID=A0A938YR61_9ARCH|nr:metallophosphoesterase [Candidatus Diapherotrites archaeon]
MGLAESREKEIVEYAGSKNALIDEKAVKLLAIREDFQEIIDLLLSEGTFIIDQKAVEEKALRTKIAEMAKPEVVVEHKAFKPHAKEIEPNFRLLKQYDVTGQSKTEGKVKDFEHYFQRKFEMLSGILKKRHTLSAKPIQRLRAVPKGSKIDVIGMVFRKWVTKNGHVAMQIEDMEAKCIALILKDDIALTEAVEHIMPDDVIAVRAVKWNEGMLIVKEIIRPDLPVREPKRGERNVAIASISDIHMGSKLFLEKPFQNFLQWINGKTGSMKENEKVSRIKYLIVSGDNIDGVGIYPNQFNELNIKDVHKQYEEVSKLIMQIPEYIEVFICPGQHDAVRWADPQPAIPKEFLPELSKTKNVHLIGSPSWISIEGMLAMVYHGAALHDLISSVSFLSSEKPEEAMIEALKRRDLMAAFGMKQPYVPEREDFLVIREEPDLVYIGDMHHNAYGSYRGTTVINSGTWQSRTNYQVKLGHVPTPCVVPVLNLKTGKINENRFMQEQ